VAPSPRKHVAEPGLETEAVEKTRLAPRYRVIVHNDDVTPMPLVVSVLTGIFRLEAKVAARIMWEAHRTGVAHVATLALEEAEVRCERAHALARGFGYPLTFTYEPE
jgi:ATP-dependent Clp protease adaptor protein ClpS